MIEVTIIRISLQARPHMLSDALPNPPFQLRAAHIRVITLALVVMCVGLAIIWGHELRQMRHIQTNVAQIEALKISVQELVASVEQQDSLVKRAFGNVVPIKIPAGSEQELEHIQTSLNNYATLLSDKFQTQALSDKLDSIVERLPVWVQTEMAPRIIPLRWQLDALELLQRETPANVDDMQDLAGDLSGLTLTRPKGTPEDLDALLLARAKTVSQESAKLETEQEAQREKEAVQQSFLAQIQAVHSDTAVFESLTDPLLQEQLATALYNTTQELNLLARTSKLDAPKITSDLDTLASAARTRLQDVRKAAVTQQAAIARKYQIWALDQLRNIPELKAINAEKIDAIGSTIDRHNPLAKAHKTALTSAQDALVNILITQLSIIDTRLLDDAVSEWYRKVFSNRFASLEEAHQLKVVEGFAISTKRAPEELP